MLRDKDGISDALPNFLSQARYDAWSGRTSLSPLADPDDLTSLLRGWRRRGRATLRRCPKPANGDSMLRPRPMHAI